MNNNNSTMPIGKFYRLGLLAEFFIDNSKFDTIRKTRVNLVCIACFNSFFVHGIAELCFFFRFSMNGVNKNYDLQHAASIFHRQRISPYRIFMSLPQVIYFGIMPDLSKTLKLLEHESNRYSFNNNNLMFMYKKSSKTRLYQRTTAIIKFHLNECKSRK